MAIMHMSSLQDMSILMDMSGLQLSSECVSRICGDSMADQGYVKPAWTGFTCLCEA
jgi:hypothetical protein